MGVSGTRRTVVVTGAEGFVGRALCAALALHGHDVRAIVRDDPAHRLPDRTYAALGDLATTADAPLAGAVSGAWAVVHLAGRAHVMRDDAADPGAAYAAANVTATARVAAAAVAAGVERFVLASTVKVNGETSPVARPFLPDDPPAPQDAYARTKHAAEEAVHEACAGRPTVPLVLRLPLIYGPQVRGNVAILFDAVAAGRLLPVGAIHNRRSIVFVGNVTDAIVAALDAPGAPRGVHFVTDRDGVSTPQLVRAIGAALGSPARVVTVPVGLLRLAGTLSGRKATIDRLAGSLEVDGSSFRAATGWSARHTLADGLAATAAWWRTRHAI